MPIYEYVCDNCGASYEVIQKISDTPLESCKKCSSQLRKQISPPAIIFKGTGWYATDYAKKDFKDNSENIETDKGVNSKKTDKKQDTSAKPALTEKSETKAI